MSDYDRRSSSMSSDRAKTSSRRGSDDRSSRYKLSVTSLTYLFPSLTYLFPAGPGTGKGGIGIDRAPTHLLIQNRKEAPLRIWTCLFVQYEHVVKYDVSRLLGRLWSLYFRVSSACDHMLMAKGSVLDAALHCDVITPSSSMGLCLSCSLLSSSPFSIFQCSKRTSGFDMAPPASTLLTNAPVTDQLPGTPQSVPGILQNMFPGGSVQMGPLSLMPAQVMTQQATRHARRVYVGGLPPSANEQTIATFFSQVMTAIGGNSAGPGILGDAVVNVYINYEKKFAFVEMRSVEEASNAMALDGISFEASFSFLPFIAYVSYLMECGVSVRVKRPTDYNPALAAVLGPSLPSPHLNLAAVGLVPGAVAGAEGPDRIFVGGIPYYFSEEQMRELLESFGPLKGFDLVKDRDTGNSKGYGFCVYQDPAVTDVACNALNGLKMGDKTLTLRRAAVSNGQAKLEHESLLAQAHQHVAMQKTAFQAGGFNLLGVTLPPLTTADNPTKILCLNQVVTVDELRDDNEYEEILEDMRDECRKFGECFYLSFCKFYGGLVPGPGIILLGLLVNIIIPRPNLEGEVIPGVGKVFLEYVDAAACTNAKNMLGGRKFGGNTVTADYYPEDKFYSADYSG
ncbi:hypothetical protein Cgig2_028910 [Carnegiea gigantea]|uniref:RRM domain-containing protein n=1 Tax=Carnegiea gigantea TaxID=171969 RepID=A0A9Q1QN90_9CARY|nr:hypothetical protein Cgig2_028910 [Carnegiea gigantea]